MRVRERVDGCRFWISAKHPTGKVASNGDGNGMFLISVSLLLALLGFTFHVLWIIGAIVFMFWLAGFAFRAGSHRGRWDYW